MKVKLTVVLLLAGLYAPAQAVIPFSVVIDEIMADPSPIVGMPNTEFIELRNVSTQPVNLSGWRIGDASGFASISTAFLLQPDSAVIICATGSAAALGVFGATIGVGNFPSLDNDGELLWLRSKEGRVIHAVNYSSTWYQNAVKREGGWSLEMIDVNNPCGGTGNWAASKDARGATPGKKNSVSGINKDIQPPVLVSAFTEDSNTVVLVFDEPLDSATAGIAGNYSISDNIGHAQSAIAVAPLFNKVQLRSTAPIALNKIYTITASGVADCSGNGIGAYHTVKLGRAIAANAMEIVINEILFNPKPGGTDYVEIYNRSNAVIDLKDCYIANRSANGAVGSIKQISAENRLLFPGDYAVVTEDAAAVQNQYLVRDPSVFAVLNGMPSLPDDRGDLLLMNAQGGIIDELNYDAHWQFPLIDNDEGVALERIDYSKPTQNAANWHSAATSAGYGTPGYQNSQFKADIQVQGAISAALSVFSPDNDGFDDFLNINYRFPEQGYVCNITIFNANGQPVRYVTRNALCGLQGYYRWDGLDEKNARLPIGVYILFSEVFNLQGKTKRFKQAVTLARRLS
ncbi:MAG: lamin tail domain-containing protein [Chitinophagaceae bacterium]